MCCRLTRGHFREKMENDLLVRVRLRSALRNLNPKRLPSGPLSAICSVDFLNLTCIPQFKFVLTASLARNLRRELVPGGRPRLGKNTQALALASERRQSRSRAKAEVIRGVYADDILSLSDWKPNNDVLVLSARLNAKRNRLEVQVDLLHFGPQAYCGTKFDRAFFASRGSTGLQYDTAGRFRVGDLFFFLIVQPQCSVAEAKVLDAELRPVRGRMWREGKRARCRIGGKPEHAAEQRAYDHGGGPDLMRRAGGERLVIVAGENFGDVAERAIESEERIGSEIRIGRLRAMIAILADAGPTGEERPNRAVVIAATAEFWGTTGNDAHAPVGLVLEAGKLGDHGAGVFLIEQAKPHGNGREHAGFIDWFAVCS